jgi:hypothetical protein
MGKENKAHVIPMSELLCTKNQYVTEEVEAKFHGLV